MNFVRDLVIFLFGMLMGIVLSGYIFLLDAHAMSQAACMAPDEIPAYAQTLLEEENGYVSDFEEVDSLLILRVLNANGLNIKAKKIVAAVNPSYVVLIFVDPDKPVCTPPARMGIMKWLDILVKAQGQPT